MACATHELHLYSIDPSPRLILLLQADPGLYGKGLSSQTYREPIRGSSSDGKPPRTLAIVSNIWPSEAPFSSHHQYIRLTPRVSMLVRHRRLPSPEQRTSRSFGACTYITANLNHQHGHEGDWSQLWEPPGLAASGRSPELFALLFEP